MRLVSIQTHESGEGICLSAEHAFDLGAKPEYIALSYTWGTERQEMMCDGQPRLVSSNLEPALQALHHHFPGQLIWTDSLSINQNNQEEKTHQVGMMGKIFSSATKVGVWLGTDLDTIYGDLLDDALYDTRPNEEQRSSKRRSLLQQLSELQ